MKKWISSLFDSHRERKETTKVRNQYLLDNAQKKQEHYTDLCKNSHCNNCKFLRNNTNPKGSCDVKEIADAYVPHDKKRSCEYFAERKEIKW